jgi:hypothetical protein
VDLMGGLLVIMIAVALLAAGLWEATRGRH